MLTNRFTVVLLMTIGIYSVVVIPMRVLGRMARLSEGNKSGRSSLTADGAVDNAKR